MFRWILITVLTIGIVGVAVWGYQEHQEKNAILIQAENNFQRAFHELSYHMDLLNDKIGTSLAMNSRESLSPQLVEIWRLSSEAMADVGQLPLALLPFNKTEEFLSEIGDFTYRAAVRDLEKKPLTDKETKTLENLYKQSSELTKELRNVQHLVLENNLRWMDVQLALASGDAQADNTIIDGFKTVEKKVEGFAESNVGTGLIGTSAKEHNYQFLSGDKISKNEALQIGKEMFQGKDTNDLKITNSGKGADIQLYSIAYKDGNESGYMDIAKQGGKPISLLINRPIGKQKISLNEGLKKAESYLKENGFENMTLFQSNQYNNIGVYSFLYNDDGVRVYSDSIEVKVGLDKGDILGFSARNYYMNHKEERDIPEPKLSVKEAKNQVNPDVKINQEFLAVIDNDIGEEVLTYEFLGVMGNETYRIFINAMNGKEEKVERLDGKEINYAANF